MRDRPWIPGALAALGILAILAAVGTDSLPLVGFWIVSSLAVAWIWRTSGRIIRTGLALALLPTCVLMTFEGGLFLLPAVFALVWATLGPRHHRAETPVR